MEGVLVATRKRKDAQLSLRELLLANMLGQPSKTDAREERSLLRFKVRQSNRATRPKALCRKLEARVRAAHGDEHVLLKLGRWQVGA